MGVAPNSAKENSAKKQVFLVGKLFFAYFHTFLVLFGLLYGLFGPLLTLFNTKTSFLVLLEKIFPEKLSRLYVNQYRLLLTQYHHESTSSAQ